MEFVELYKKAYEFLETQKESRKEIPFGEVALIMTSFAEQQLKNCNLQNVSQRSELLKAFLRWAENEWMETPPERQWEQMFDEYFKSL